MRRRVIALIAVLPLLLASTAQAQEPWSVELRGGPAFALDDLGDAGLEVGYGGEATVSYRFMPDLGAYVGWDWVHFSISEDDGGGDVEETGYAFGLLFERLLPAPLPMLRVRAGGTYDHLEFESEDGDITADTDHGFGWEAGLGVVIPVGPSWQITPGARYRALSRDIEIGGIETEVDLSYVLAEIGFRRVF